MTAEKAAETAAQLLARRAEYLIATAARAPSVHNTQPWRFRISGDAIELYADLTRKLKVDPLGREMMISCGAALFGLRLAVRSLGYQPVTELFAEPPSLRLLARVRLGPPAAITDTERKLLLAMPHRHTHRGPFEDAPLPAGLLPGLQHDAVAEGSALALTGPDSWNKLVSIAAPASRKLDQAPVTRAEMRRWTRLAAQRARDGVPAPAFASGPPPAGQPGRLPQRDFDLGRGIGLLAADGPPPPAAGLLLTTRDGRADWLRTGQALHRLLLHAASRWVFASLYTQPLEAPEIRRLIKARLILPGWPQVLLQLGVARTTPATARRPPGELIDS
jgi:nitroreductase